MIFGAIWGPKMPPKWCRNAFQNWEVSVVRFVCFLYTFFPHDLSAKADCPGTLSRCRSRPEIIHSIARNACDVGRHLETISVLIWGNVNLHLGPSSDHPSFGTLLGPFWVTKREPKRSAIDFREAISSFLDDSGWDSSDVCICSAKCRKRDTARTAARAFP